MTQEAAIANDAATGREALWKGRLLAGTFVAWLLGSALAAYQVAGVPIEWMARGLVLGVGLLVAASGKMRRVPGSGPLVVLIVWAFLVTLFNDLLGGSATDMPTGATTSYTVFVSLRLVNLLAFLAALYLTYAMLGRGDWAMVVRTATWIGTLVALMALYIYVAQTYGLPEIPRNRMGTSGGLQATVFTGSYAFHRAMGTFREPGDLAEWLIVPLFVSLAYRRGRPNVHTFLIASVLLLTGSLAGIVGAAIGLMGAILLTNPFGAQSAKMILGVGLITLLGLAAFSAISYNYRGQETDLLGLLGQRLAPFFGEGGVMKTDRGQTYQAAMAMPFRAFGYGVGNANLEFSRYDRLNLDAGWQGPDLVASFLSLYLYIWFSTGVVGIVLLLAFLVRPVIRLLRFRSARGDRVVLPLHAAYLTYLVMFLFRAEELPLTFALLYALLVYAIERGTPATARA